MDSWKNAAYAYARLNVPQPTDGGSVTLKSISNSGGFASTIFIVQVTTNDNTVKSFVVKQAFQTETAKYHRLNRERREAIELLKVDNVGFKLALCNYVFNETRPNDGEVDLVMEDLGELGGVQSGLDLHRTGSPTRSKEPRRFRWRFRPLSNRRSRPSQPSTGSTAGESIL
eukprot:PhF_6_TR39708/c0_g1_i6/m.59059